MSEGGQSPVSHSALTHMHCLVFLQRNSNKCCWSVMIQQVEAVPEWGLLLTDIQHFIQTMSSSTDLYFFLSFLSSVVFFFFKLV